MCVYVCYCCCCCILNSSFLSEVEGSDKMDVEQNASVIRPFSPMFTEPHRTLLTSEIRRLNVVKTIPLLYFLCYHFALRCTDYMLHCIRFK